MLKKQKKIIILFSALVSLLFVSFSTPSTAYASNKRGEIELLNIVED